MFHKSLEKRIEDLEKRVDYVNLTVCPSKISSSSVVDCETCGCMISVNKAVKGKSEIRIKKGQWEPTFIGGCMLMPDQEYIYTPYYCKRCTSKEKK